ncbi:MAG: glycosyltransferase [Desulfitobacteriaceae bacterium]
MKVALITAQLSIGGAEKMLYHLAQGLHQRGHRVTVIAAAGIYGTKLREAGLEVIKLPLSSKWKWLLPAVWLRLYRLMRRENFDIVHVHTAPLAFFVRVLQRLGRIRARTVLTLHGSPAWKLKLTRIWLKVLKVERCAVSPALAQMVEARYIFNAVELERGKVEDRQANEICHTSENSEPKIKIKDKREKEIAVGIVARLVPEKGLDLWLKAVRDLAHEGIEIKTLIAGDGPERTRLEKESLTCAQEIIFCGWLSDPWQVMAGAELMVLPSRREGEPLALLEGMARGKLVLATGVGGVPPLLEGGAGILVEPSVAGLVRGVREYLALTSSQKEDMLSQARTRIAGRTWDNCLDQYEQVYADVSG